MQCIDPMRSEQNLCGFIRNAKFRPKWSKWAKTWIKNWKKRVKNESLPKRQYFFYKEKQKIISWGDTAGCIIIRKMIIMEKK